MSKLIRPSRRSLLLAAPAVILSRQSLAHMMGIIGDTHQTGGGGGGNPFSLVAHTAAADSGGSALTTTSAINTTGANLFVMGGAYYTGGGSILIGDFSDSAGNTWSACNDYNGGAAAAGAMMAYCYGGTTSASHTFTLNIGTGYYQSLFVAAFSGAAVSPLDQQNGASSASAASLAPGSVTPSANNELLVTLLCENSAGVTPSVGSSFVVTDTIASVSGTNIGGAMAYLKQTTASAVNPTWSWTGTTLCATGIATFK